MRMEPPPSLAPAMGTTPAATAAPEPPLEPPGVSSMFHGLRLGPQRADSVTALRPNSGVAVRPINTKPALRARCTNCESRLGILLRKARLPQVQGCPACSWARSFSNRGTPENGPSDTGACPMASEYWGWQMAFKAPLT